MSGDILPRYRLCNCTLGAQLGRCCQDPPSDPAPAVMAPFKCPDCGTWFAYEHRCQPAPKTTTTTLTNTWGSRPFGTV